MGLALSGPNGLNFFKSLKNFGVMSLKSISALMSMTAHVCSGRIFCDTNSSKRSIKAGTFFHLHGKTGGVGMTSEVFQKVAAVFNGFVDIESGDGTGRTGCHVIRTCQYYCRPVIDFRQPGGYDADDAFMPVFIVQYDGTSVGKSVQVSYNLVGLLGHGLVKSLRVSLYWLICPAFSRAREKSFFSKQVNSFFPVLDTSGGVDAGTYFEYNVTDGDVLVRQSADINDCFQAYAGITVQLLQNRGRRECGFHP